MDIAWLWPIASLMPGCQTERAHVTLVVPVESWCPQVKHVLLEVAALPVPK